MTLSKDSRLRTLVAEVFISPHDRRLRSGWRVLIQAMLAIGLSLIFAVPFILFTFTLNLFFGIDYTSLEALTVFVSTPAIVISVWIARRFLDKRSFVSLGLNPDSHTVPDLVIGFLIPAVLMGAVLGFFYLLGWVTWEGWSSDSAPMGRVVIGVMFGLFIYILVGFYEELLFRGYQLQNFAVGSNLFWGVLLSSVLFGIAHFTNPSASMFSTLGILAAGIFLAYGWIRTRQLWLPIGLHIGWNFFEGTIFGFPVSGTTPFRLMRHSIQGPDLITGGAFGPEAGLIVLPAMLIGALIVREYTKERFKTLHGTPYDQGAPNRADEVSAQPAISSEDETL